MAPFIKICGIKKYDHVKVAEKNGALWYGLVFHKKSPRFIDLHDAEKIVKKSNKSIFPVCFFGEGYFIHHPNKNIIYPC